MTVPRPTRILMLLENESYPSDIRVLLEAQSLTRAGYQVTVISPTGSDDSGLRATVDGVEVYRYPQLPDWGGLVGYLLEYSYTLSTTLAISLYLLLRRGFDVIHLHSPPDLFVLIALLYKLAGKHYVLDHHDLSPELYAAKCEGQPNRVLHRVLFFFERLACRWADQLIATNTSQQRVQLERCGVDEERTNVVRNGPDLQMCRPAPPLEEFQLPGRTIIGYLGVIGYQDGVDYLLRALVHLRNDMQRTDFLALIVGSGPAIPSLKRLTSQLDLTDHVHFAGFLTGESLRRHLSTTDICVTPDPSNSYNDSCTMIKIMEYMAFSKPVVAFDLPEHRVTASDAALYAAPNSEHELAGCLAVLMDNPQTCADMGRRGRQRVEELWAWKHQEQHLLDTYHKLVSQPHVNDRSRSPAGHPIQLTENRRSAV